MRTLIPLVVALSNKVEKPQYDLLLSTMEVSQHAASMEFHKATNQQLYEISAYTTVPLWTVPHENYLDHIKSLRNEFVEFARLELQQNELAGMMSTEVILMVLPWTEDDWLSNTDQLGLIDQMNIIASEDRVHMRLFIDAIGLDNYAPSEIRLKSFSANPK